MTELGITMIDGYELRCTCLALPEQYDVYRDGAQVGYIRFRWGVLRVDVPDAGGETVLCLEPDGNYNELSGMFRDEDRQPLLEQSVRAIKKAGK